MTSHKLLTKVLLAALLGTGANYADSLLFDFGADATQTFGGPGGPTTTWNNVTGIGLNDFGILEGLVTDDGNFTALGLQMVSRFNGENLNGTLSPSQYPVSATQDSLYGNTEEFNGLSNITPIFKIYGLDSSATYSFTFYASRLGVGDNRETIYTVTGAAESTAALNVANNQNNTASVTNVAPDAAGEITIALTPGPNNNNANHFTYLGVLEIMASTGERFLMDFGANSSLTDIVEAPPMAMWNNVLSDVGTVDGGVIDSLVTTNGTYTSMSLRMESRFNTFNTAGATTSTNYPVTATQDSLFGNTEAFNGLSNIQPEFVLAGLDPNYQFTFTFYGSRTGATDNRETRYTVTGANSGEGLLNTANNINNTVTVADIRPNDLGEITIALTPGPNNNNANHFVYLNLMQVDFAPIRTPRILIDFGGANTMDLGVDDPFDAWNNLTGAIGSSNTGVLSDLVRTDGTETSAGVQIVSRFNGVNENGTLLGTLGGAPYPVDATRDSLYGNTEEFGGASNITPIFKLTGLNPSIDYDLSFYASRMSVGDNRETRYTVTGASETFVDLNVANNEIEIAVIEDVRPNAAGEIQIALTPGPNNDNGNHFTYLGVLQIDWEAPVGSDAPTLSSAQVAGGNFQFTINGTAGVAYTVERTTTFNSWEEVKTVTVGSASESVEVPASGDAAFYRVVAK